MSTNLNLSDINPLEHITGDIAISQANYESVMNGLVQWNMSKMDNITIRVATRTDPYFVDYVIPTKYFYDHTYGNVSSDTLLPSGRLSYNNREQLGIAKDDNIVIRVNVADNGGTEWALYKDVTVYNEYSKVLGENGTYTISRNAEYAHGYVDGLYIRGYDNHQFVLYKTIGTIVAGVPTYQNTVPVVYETRTGQVGSGYAREIIVDSGKGIVYALKPGSTLPSESFSISDSTKDYYAFATVYNPADSTRVYEKGEIVYYKGNFYVCKVDSTVLPPALLEYEDDTWTFYPDQWDEVLPLRLNLVNIDRSVNFRTIADTDMSGLILANVADGTTSGSTTRVTLSTSISYPGLPSSQPTGVEILPTSNYVNWPDSDASKWEKGGHYSTNVSLDAHCKQDYSSVMVFSHFDPDVRYKNIVNYDGPDLDQGLCIMLPVTVHDRNNETHDPVDGCMFEFMFNIWPNHDYDDRDVNDLIINKSQIYVYSVQDMEDFATDGFNSGTVEPIAKFSMARLVNFYVESENIGVPDRPVCYKARFIYSQAEHRWKTYDYYQLPDHIFMSPHGFVDPTTQESAGFPLYQNPFSDYDLSAIRKTGTVRNQYQAQLDEE